MQHYDDDYSLYGVLADGEPAVNTIPKNFREPHIKIDVSDGLLINFILILLS
nr:MAG: hypothetical protein CM15mV30_0990 [uncultured marine virus]